ncbi:hypothetical protein [Rickettsiella endosymbiont of Dermanyssus gallinae]|nr:hypothetical protein [Rickettsiella endosymbiont of Dermanyssus gallinae]
MISGNYHVLVLAFIIMAGLFLINEDYYALTVAFVVMGGLLVLGVCQG